MKDNKLTKKQILASAVVAAIITMVAVLSGFDKAFSLTVFIFWFIFLLIILT